MYLIKLTSQSALEVDGRITGTLDEHKKYFDYLKAGNGDKAYSILIDHLMMPLNVACLMLLSITTALATRMAWRILKKLSGTLTNT